MQWLKQSTAITLKIGPFTDDTDGKTAETGLTIAQADVRLSKNGGNIAQKNESTSCTHDELGIYGCPLDTTDTTTLGRLQLWVHESGALPVWHEFMVVPANVWDSVFGSDKLQVDATQIEGSDATDQIRDAVVDDATRIDASALNTLSGHDPGATLCADGTPLTAAETESEVNDALLALHLDHLLAADYDPTSKPGIATALLNELVENDGGVSRFTENALEQAPSGTGASAASIADAVWDEALSAHDTEDSVGNVLNDLIEESGGTYRFTEAALAEAPSSAGAGAIIFTYTLTSSVDSSPIASATVWVTTDQAGTNVVASGTTNTSGEVTFYLDAGTYYVWREKSGWNFTNPDTETVA